MISNEIVCFYFYFKSIFDGIEKILILILKSIEI